MTSWTRLSNLHCVDDIDTEIDAHIALSIMRVTYHFYPDLSIHDLFKSLDEYLWNLPEPGSPHDVTLRFIKKYYLSYNVWWSLLDAGDALIKPASRR